MRMVYGPGDEDAFGAARDKLTSRYAAWAAARDRDVDVLPVSVALDYKMTGGNGLLGRWTTADLRELLADWAPRQVNLPVESWAAVPPALHAFVDFLADLGLADGRGDEPAVLHDAIDALEGEFRAAMADRANWGPAKFWATLMMDHGVDPADQTAVQNFIADTRGGRNDVDEETIDAMAAKLLAAAVPAPPRLPPPVILPSDDELAAAAEQAELVGRLRAFTEWVGAGKALTQTGRLKLADARHLVELLGTGDVIDPVIGDRVVKTRSSEQLYQLGVVVEWAKAARLVRLVKGRLVTVKTTATLRDRPLALWERAANSFDKLGGAICGGAWGGWPLRPEFEAAVGVLLEALFAMPLPMGLARRLVWDVVTRGCDPDNERYAEMLRSAVAADLDRLIEQLELLGMVQKADAGGLFDPDKIEELAEELDGLDDLAECVQLSPLGRWFVRRRLRATGYHVPTVEELAAEEAEVVIASCAASGPELVDAALSAWCGLRGPNRSAVELLALLRRTDDPAHRLCVYRGFDLIGAVGAEAVRTLVDDEALGPAAKSWLVEQGHAPELTLSPADHADAIVDLLAGLTRLGGPASTLAALGDLGATPADVVTLLGIARLPHAEEVLDTIATQHPDKKIARTARKSLLAFRSRSGSAGRRG